MSSAKNAKHSSLGRVMSQAARASSSDSAARESARRLARKYSRREEWAKEKSSPRRARKVAVRKSCFHWSGMRPW